ncbi:MAG: restriction endonuclease subunit S [Actinomycetota bacterium]|nr:restriction endonuclease subunit S [Actinomycetota bacterium]
MTEWPKVRLRDLCESVQYGVTASASTESDRGPQLLRITDIVPSRIDWTAVPTCEIPESVVAKFQLSPGDIVVARTGATVGHAKFIDHVPGRAVFASYLVRFRVGPRADASYVGHIVQSAPYKEFVLSHAGGAAQPNANAQILGAFPVPVPDCGTQRRIAAVLSAFDNLIEINERRIEVLENLARSLYREWFVRFRFPGHEDVELVDSELGAIPEGWEVRRLGDVLASLVDGDWIETKDQGGDAFRLLQVSNIGVGAFRETGKFRYISSETFDRLSCTEVRHGDILVSRMPEPIGRGWLVDDLREPAITAVDVAIARPASSEHGIYLNYWLNSRATLSHAEGMATGTTRKRISRSVLSRLELLVPNRDSVLRFGQYLAPLLSEQTALRRSLFSLAATRDLLLPRLVTGRLDISDLDLGDLLPAEAA